MTVKTKATAKYLPVLMWGLWTIALLFTVFQLMQHHMSGGQRTSGSEIADLVEETGDVAFRGQLDVDWQSAGDVDSFYEEELLSTGPDSKIRLDFGDDRYLDLESNTLIKLSKPKGLSQDVEIFLITGNIKAGIKPAAKGSKKSKGRKAISKMVIATSKQKIVLEGDGSDIELNKVGRKGGVEVKSTTGKINSIIAGKVRAITKPEVIQAEKIIEKSEAVALPLDIVNSTSIVKDIKEITEEQNRVSLLSLSNRYKNPKIEINKIKFKGKRISEVSLPENGKYKIALTLMNSSKVKKLGSLLNAAEKFNFVEGEEIPSKGVFFVTHDKVVAFMSGPFKSSKNSRRLMKLIGAKVAFKGKLSSFVSSRKLNIKKLPKSKKEIFLASDSLNLVNLDIQLARKFSNFGKNSKISNSIVFRSPVKIR